MAGPCPGAPGAAPLGARAVRAALTWDSGEAEQQQAEEESDGERTRLAGGHGAEPGRSAGVSRHPDAEI